jgi:restriction system protein
MPIPDFQDITLPLLQLLQDGEPHDIGELKPRIAAHFNLTPEEQSELLPSGPKGGTRFGNRFGWARTHLKMAGLINYERSGVYRITDRGKQVLSQSPLKLDAHFLDQFPEHIEFRKGKGTPVAKPESPLSDLTPQERLEQEYETIRGALSQDLLERISGASPAFFERLVVQLLVAMGYGGSDPTAGRTVGGSGDDGIVASSMKTSSAWMSFTYKPNDGKVWWDVQSFKHSLVAWKEIVPRKAFSLRHHNFRLMQENS